MFIAEKARVPLPFPAAATRLANLTRCAVLAGVSRRAYQDGAEALLRVGPFGGTAGFAKLVRIRFLAPSWSERGMSIGIRWEAEGGGAALFPVLDADLVLSPASLQTCTLACSGVYRPPLGRLGAALDRAVMNHIATATIRSLLQRLAAEMVSPSAAPSQQITGEPAVQPVIPADGQSPEPGR